MPQPVLHVRLLGGFHLALDHVPVAGISTPRLQSLVAYLLLHADAPQLRSHLAFLFWPDVTEAQARNNLRQFLYQLRHTLPSPDRFLLANTGVLGWKNDEAQEVDVIRFQSALNDALAAEEHGEPDGQRRCLEQALAVYQGDLLPSCYDDWIAPERERLRQECFIACHKLVILLEARRDYAAALHAVQRLLQLDPLDESAYVTLMRLHGLLDDRAAALRVYQSAVRVLQRELDVEPGEGLKAAYHRLQQPPRIQGSSSEVTTPPPLTLVGRQAEWRQAQAVWQQAAAGDAQLLLITGEAGIGKSRLAEELFEWVTRQGFVTARTRSYGAEGRLSLAPVTEWLRCNTLRPHLAALDPVWLTEIARLLPTLLSDFPTLTQPDPINEYGHRQRFFEALARGVLAAPHPLLLWIDDLQWSDQETLEWLHFLLRFESSSDFLILGTSRSEDSPPNHPLSTLVRQLREENKVSSIELSALDVADTAALAVQVRGHALDETAITHLFRETEGYPLFVVEAVRAGFGQTAIAESGSQTAIARPEVRFLPPRIQAIISGRLAQLSPAARQVAEVGATLGRAFTLDFLLSASHEDEEIVVGALDELWQRRIVSELRANLFDFTHDKLREVIYVETSLPHRRLLHRRVAQALETLHAAALDPVSAEVAIHYEEAGLPAEAISHYHRAGVVAANVYANDRAIALLTRGLTLLSQLAPGTLRDTQELNLQLVLAPLYRVTRGWASPEVEQCLNRSLLLSDTVGDTAQRMQTLYGLQSLYVVAARLEKVQYTYAEMDSLFVQSQSSPPPFAGLMHAGARLHMGHLPVARAQFESVVAERDSRHIRDLQASQGVNYLVLGQAWNAHALWCLGYAQAAQQSALEAAAIAQEFEQPFNQALAITYMATLQEWCADEDSFLAYARDAHEFTREYQVTYYHAWSSILLHFAEVWRRPEPDGLTHLRNAIHRFMEMGSHLRLPLFFSLLARACQHAGKMDEALDAIEVGLTEALQNNERWWDADLHRLRGEWLAAQGAETGDIETAFQRALEIARSQNSKSLELRAATGLARLWQSTSRHVEAQQLLTSLYDSFTEGFDTPDLQAARALIARL